MPALPAADRPAFLEITWHDAETGAVGYVVIDRLLRGVSSGGLRMRNGCTLQEVRGLADAMTKKEAVHLCEGLEYVPVGGAKGGIDYDPRAPDAAAVIERFLEALSPVLRSYWAVGEDLGVRQDTIDEIYERRGWGSPVASVRALVADGGAADERLASAFGVVVDGVAQDELVGGFGVTVAALSALAARGHRADEVRAVVQGFGSMGGATARFLTEAGVRVVGIVDAEGMVVDPAGLDVDALLARRSPLGTVDRDRLPGGAVARSGDAWWATDCELLVPAAISHCITVDNCDEIRARIVVEAANLPVTPDAEAALALRGVEVIPDFIANSGTNAWWWWLLFGDVDGSWEDSRRMLRRRLGELTEEVLERADRDGATPRGAALELSAERLARIEAREAQAVPF